MKFRIESGKRVFEIKGVAIDGFNLHHRFIADAVATTPTGVNLLEVDIKAVLHQEGEKFEIIPKTSIAALHEDYFATKYPVSGGFVATTGILAGEVVITQDASTKGENHATTPIRFGGGIVLKRGDKIILEVTINSGAYGTNCDDDSYMLIEPNEVVTNQMFVPKLEVFPIPVTESKLSLNLGDNVQTANLICIDAANEKETTAIFTDVEVVTDRLTYDRTFAEMRSLRSLDIDWDNNTRYYQLLKGEEFDDVQVNLELTPANINSDKNFVVVRSFETDRDIAEVGRARFIKHEGRKARKFGFNQKR